MLAALSEPDSTIEATAPIAARCVGAPIDPNGNLGSDGPNSYTWNVRNQLVVLSGGTSATFQYDGVGRRRGKTVSGATTNFLYDGLNFVQEQTGGGMPTANLLTGLGIDETLMRSGADGTKTILPDALGSTLGLADTSGTLQTHYTYEPFGTTIADGTTNANVVQFTGREDDSVGFYYYRARYYQPGLARFLSEDPIGFMGGPNIYLYAFDNPVDFKDALGLDANSLAYGEIRSFAVGPPPGYASPAGLGDAKASIAAACALNGNCNSVDGSSAVNPADKAAWRNITKASGVDKSGGGNFMCVGHQRCWFVHECYKCVNGKQTLVNRGAPLNPSGTVAVGAHTVYFYNDPLQGWCNAKDRQSACRCK